MAQFSDQIRDFSVKCGIMTDQVVRKIVFDLFRRIMFKTPVDTGMLRANWQIGIDKRPSGIIDTTDPSGAGAVSGIASGISKVKAGGHVYIVNNLSYALCVELGLYGERFRVPTQKVTAQGFSTQAPAGMARISVQEIVDHMNAVLDGGAA